MRSEGQFAFEAVGSPQIKHLVLEGAVCIQGVHGTKTTQHALAVDYVTVAGVLEKLQANIQEDHQLTCGFMYATWKRVSACHTIMTLHQNRPHSSSLTATTFRFVKQMQSDVLLVCMHAPQNVCLMSVTPVHKSPRMLIKAFVICCRLSSNVYVQYLLQVLLVCPLRAKSV